MHQWSKFFIPFFLAASLRLTASPSDDSSRGGLKNESSSRSSAVAAQMGLKYTPLPEREPTIKTLDEIEPSLPDIVLPKMMVNESRIRLSERDALSAKGRLELAQQRYLTPLYKVTFGPLSQIAGYYFNWLSILHGWHPNEAEAMTLYREDDRRRILTEMDSLIRLESIDDTKDAEELKRMRFEVRQAGINGLYW